MIKGRLYYIARADRFFLVGDNANDYYALHCGDVLDIFLHGRWKKTSVEAFWRPKGIAAWYLVDTPFHGEAMQGLRARVGC